MAVIKIRPDKDTPLQEITAIKGADGLTVSVNNVEQVEGNITLTKTDIGLGSVDNIKQMPKTGGTLGTYRETYADITSTAGNATINIANACNFVHTVTEATTYSITATGIQDYEIVSFTIIAKQGSTGYPLYFPASVKWDESIMSPEFSAPDITFVLTFISYDKGVTWYGMMGGGF